MFYRINIKGHIKLRGRYLEKKFLVNTVFLIILFEYQSQESPFGGCVDKRLCHQKLITLSVEL